MSVKDADRVAQLEQEVARLTAALDHLLSQVPKASQPRPNAGEVFAAAYAKSLGLIPTDADTEEGDSDE